MARRTLKKKCRDCGQLKELTHFHNHKSNPLGKQPYCKPCDNIRKLKSYYFTEYGVTWEYVEEIKKQQDYSCAICGKKRILHVDHNHATGEFRGVICGNCNRALGFVNEDIDVLKGLITWLEVH